MNVNTVVVIKDTKMEIFDKPDQIIRFTFDEQLKRIQSALKDRNLSKVASYTKLHENTVRAVASGKNVNPTLETVEKLSLYLFGGENEK